MSAPLRPRPLDVAVPAVETSVQTPSQRLAATIGAAPSPGAARALLMAYTERESPAVIAASASAVAAALPSVALAHEVAMPRLGGMSAAEINTGLAMPAQADAAEVMTVSPIVGTCGAFLPLEPLDFPTAVRVSSAAAATAHSMSAASAVAARRASAAISALAKSSQFTTSAATLARFFKVRGIQLPVFTSTAVDQRKPVWHEDTAVTDCTQCHQQFSLVRLRHHCRNCGFLVCGYCSTHTMDLPHLLQYNAPQRVCDSCHTILSFRLRGGRPEDLLSFINDSYVPMQLLPLLQVKFNLKHQYQVESAQKPTYLLDGLQSLRLQRGYFSLAYVTQSPSGVMDAHAPAQTNNQFSALNVQLADGRLPFRFLAITPYPNSYIALTGVLPHVTGSASTYSTEFSVIRNIDDLENISAFNTSKGNSKGGSVRFEYGVTLHFKDRSELNLILHSPVDAWPEKFDLGALEAQLSAATAAMDVASLLQSRKSNELTSVTSVPAPLLSTHVSIAMPNLCFDSVDAMRAFEQEEIVQTFQQITERRQANVARQTKRLAALYQLTQVKVDWANEAHVTLLQRMWTLMAPLPGVSFPGTKHEHWKLLGFQGTDPGTDFRGMGQLALQCLVYFAQHHMTLCHELVAAQLAGRSYPLAVAVINFCSVLGDQLKLKQFVATVDVEGTPLFRLFCELDDEFQFEEVLIAYVRLFDRLWVETAAGYMDFPHVLSEVKSRINAELARGPLSTSVFCAWLQATEAATPQTLEDLKKKKLGH